MVFWREVSGVHDSCGYGRSRDEEGGRALQRAGKQAREVDSVAERLAMATQALGHHQEHEELRKTIIGDGSQTRGGCRSDRPIVRKQHV